MVPFEYVSTSFTNSSGGISFFLRSCAHPKSIVLRGRLIAQAKYFLVTEDDIFDSELALIRTIEDRSRPLGSLPLLRRPQPLPFDSSEVFQFQILFRRPRHNRVGFSSVLFGSLTYRIHSCPGVFLDGLLNLFSHLDAFFRNLPAMPFLPRCLPSGRNLTLERFY